MFFHQGRGKSMFKSNGQYAQCSTPVSAALSDLNWWEFYSSLDGMLVHRKATPSVY